MPALLRFLNINTCFICTGVYLFRIRGEKRRLPGFVHRMRDRASASARGTVRNVLQFLDTDSLWVEMSALDVFAHFVSVSHSGIYGAVFSPKGCAGCTPRYFRHRLFFDLYILL